MEKELKDIPCMRFVNYLKCGDPMIRYNKITRFIPSFLMRIFWDLLRWHYWYMIRKCPELQQELESNLRGSFGPNGDLGRRLVER